MSRPAHPCPKVLSFGEILWDIFGDRETIGGAPFNVAAHLAQFGIQSHFYSRIGSDRRGSLARHRLLDLGVSDTWLQVDPTRATGRVNVSLDAAGQPSYAIGADAAWDAIEAPTPPIADELVIENFSALVCGTLAQRSKGNQRALAAIRAILPGVPVFYDVNLRGSETPLATVLQTLPGTTLVKMNEAEMVAIAEKILGRVPPAEDFYSALHDRYGVRVLLCTRGAEGCPVHHEGGDAFTSPVRPVEVACNPLIATIYPTNKTTKLNHFHAWFPGGIVIGGLVSYALNATGFGWKVQFASMALPLAVYGFMFVGQKFPRTERVEQGISTGAMFAACVRPGFLLMVACMMMTAATELGPGQWISFGTSLNHSRAQTNQGVGPNSFITRDTPVFATSLRILMTGCRVVSLMSSQRSFLTSWVRMPQSKQQISLGSSPRYFALFAATVSIRRQSTGDNMPISRGSASGGVTASHGFSFAKPSSG